MSYAHANQHATGNHVSGLGAILNRVSSLYHETVDALGRYRVFRQTYDELSALSNRQLADLGINRSMITRIAMDAAQGDK